MNAENLAYIIIPLLVLAVLWTMVRHWILPFVLGFALAVALGPSARPMLASAWDAIASVGDALFRGGPRGGDAIEPRERYLERGEPGRGRYDEQDRR